ncbi:MAG: AAA family ATPase [Opitutaceae bacterium]
MIRSYFGLTKNPFDPEGMALLGHQKEILEVLRVHCQQGGLCLVAGEPGTGKSVIKTALQAHDPKRLVTPSVGRTLHTYHNTIRILCQAFEIEFDGGDFKVERQLIDQAFNLHRTGKLLAVLIDDAHLMPMECLRRLRLLFEEFPRTHNVVLFSQAEMLRTLRLTVNQDLHSRLTYSATLRKLAPDAVEAFVLGQFDRCCLPHNTLAPEALALIARSSDGVLRAARNLTLATLIEAVRAQKRQAGLELVNKALLQPHWRTIDELI